MGAEEEGLEEEEEFPEGVRCSFVGRGIIDVIVWRESGL
jgi:hypothetical protein